MLLHPQHENQSPKRSNSWLKFCNLFWLQLLVIIRQEIWLLHCEMFLTQSKCALAITRWDDLPPYTTHWKCLKKETSQTIVDSLSACRGLNGYRDLRAFSSSYLWTMSLYAQQCIHIEGKESPEKEPTEIQLSLESALPLLGESW
jgi:hypothetical protein